MSISYFLLINIVVYNLYSNDNDGFSQNLCKIWFRLKFVGKSHLKVNNSKKIKSITIRSWHPACTTYR